MRDSGNGGSQGLTALRAPLGAEANATNALAQMFASTFGDDLDMHPQDYPVPPLPGARTPQYSGYRESLDWWFNTVLYRAVPAAKEGTTLGWTGVEQSHDVLTVVVRTYDGSYEHGAVFDP